MFYLYLLLSLAIVAAATDSSPVDMASLVDHCDDGTTFNRKQAIACLLDAVDKNHNGELSKSEIEALPSTYLHWWERAYISIWLGVDPIAEVMKGCDVDKNGVITYSDMVAGVNVCMPIVVASGKPTHALCLLKKYICDRANTILGHNVYK